MNVSDLIPNESKYRNDIAVSGNQADIEHFCEELEDRGYELNPLVHLFDNHLSYYTVLVSRVGSYAKVDKVDKNVFKEYLYPEDRKEIRRVLDDIDITTTEAIQDRENLHAASIMSVVVNMDEEIYKLERTLETHSKLGKVGALISAMEGISNNSLIELKKVYEVFKIMPFVLTEEIFDKLIEQEPSHIKTILHCNFVPDSKEVQDKLEELVNSFGAYEDNSGNQIWSVYYHKIGIPCTYCIGHDQYHFSTGYKTKNEVAQDIADGTAYISTVINSQQQAISMNSPVLAESIHKGNVCNIAIQDGLVTVDVAFPDFTHTYDITNVEAADYAEHDYNGHKLVYGQQLWTINQYDKMTTQPNAGFIGEDGNSYLEDKEAMRFNPTIREVYLFSKRKEAEGFLMSRRNILSLDDICKLVDLSEREVRELLSIVAERTAIIDQERKAYGTK